MNSERGIFFIRLMLVLLVAGPLQSAAVHAERMSEREILQKAVDYAARERESFRPYKFKMDTHVRVVDGDDQLEEESMTYGTYIQWTADSVETVSEREEILFRREGEDEMEDDDSANEEDEEESLESDFDFWSPASRKLYRFRLEEIETRGDRELARIKVRPKKKRRGLWRGKVWVDTATGAMLEVDVDPSKSRFAVRRMNIKGTFRELDNQIVPRQMNMALEVKLPLIVHIKINMDMHFTECGFVDP
ncbi:MAG: hypothetical protein GY835_02365 [bacterium]|nr:hypothetical protein [bacterium]